ncbi:hypothetical protein AU255_18520 [Methyloprofundus sedimenti]|uniref:Uncharacterized protein n=1 Tax=Methyloprofundus sedimenti TaxID=1420851 RepID=A0A1V8M0U2_9GAMM|nr:hypothetical protein [Methyloprofundus sedimenti]OQK15159.1 hypothetical protein AU255_18520 [Methyloprofundus sedimenti]
MHATPLYAASFRLDHHKITSISTLSFSRQLMASGYFALNYSIQLSQALQALSVIGMVARSRLVKPGVFILKSQDL